MAKKDKTKSQLSSLSSDDKNSQTEKPALKTSRKKSKTRQSQNQKSVKVTQKVESNDEIELQSVDGSAEMHDNVVGDDVMVTGDKNGLESFETTEGADIINNDDTAAVVTETEEDTEAYVETETTGDADSKSEDKAAKTKKKRKWTRRLITFNAIILLGVISGAFLANWYKNYLDSQKTDYSTFLVEDYIDNTYAIVSKATGIENPSEDDLNNFVNLAISNNKTPLDFSPSENFALANFNASLATSFSAIGTGAVDTIANQSVYSAKMFDGHEYSFESISKGSLLTIANCIIKEKNSNKITVIEGKNASENSASWTGKSTDYTEEEFKDFAGVLPSELFPYIISSKTILNEQDVEIAKTELDGKEVYAFTVELDKITSVLNYHKQVKFSSGLSDSPSFSDITIKIYIDGRWNFVRSEITEHYSVVYGITAKCTGTLTTDYTFNQPVTMPQL